MRLFIELVAQIIDFGSKAVNQRLLVGAFRRNGVRLLVTLLVVSLFNLCIHLSILRMRFLSGMDIVLSIDEISTVFEASVKPTHPNDKQSLHRINSHIAFVLTYESWYPIWYYSASLLHITDSTTVTIYSFILAGENYGGNASGNSSD